MAKKTQTKTKTRKAETTKPSSRKAKAKATESAASRPPRKDAKEQQDTMTSPDTQQVATTVAAESMPRAEQEAPATAETTPPTPTSASPDTRLPAKGTVLQKRDRQGTVRCECEIVDGGVKYRKAVYRSLSAAAIAAAKDLGLAAKAMNGFTFWGISKPARQTDPLATLEKAWTRYWSHLESTLEEAKSGEHREPVLTAIQRHARVLQNLHDEVV